MAYTYAQAKEFLKDRAGEDASTLASRVYLTIAQRARAKMSDLGDMLYDRRQIRLVLPGVKNDGTVSVASGGTAVTGVGTNFNSADLSAGGDVERFFRFQSEGEQYRISAVGSTLGATIADGYAQASALSGAAYEITTERIKLPDRFRKCNKVIQTTLGGWLKLQSMDELLVARTKLRSVSEPRNFAIEAVENSSGYRMHWLNVFPAPAELRVIVMNIYEHPPLITGDSSTFQLPEVPSAIDAHQEIMEAMLAVYLKTGDQNGVNDAISNARRKLGSFRATDADVLAEEWTPEGDTDGNMQTFERIRVPGY